MSRQPTIEVHSKLDCPYCTDVKGWLALKGIPFTEVRHDDDADRAQLYDRLGLVGAERTVPQVIVNDGDEQYRIGGAHATKVSGIESLFQTNEAMARDTARFTPGSIRMRDDENRLAL